MEMCALVLFVMSPINGSLLNERNYASSEAGMVSVANVECKRDCPSSLEEIQKKGKNIVGTCIPIKVY